MLRLHALVTDGCFEAPAVTGDAAVFMPVESLGEQVAMVTVPATKTGFVDCEIDVGLSVPQDFAISVQQFGGPKKTKTFSVGPAS